MELDKEQKLAVETKKRNVLVAAAAGSGKTRVITERLKFLLDNGADPSKVFAITYTNAAAQEMRNRVGNSEVFIGTIHSLANRILLLNGVDTSGCLDDEEFDKLFEMTKKESVELPEVEHLLIDEFQDICENEYEFTMETLKPRNFFVVGDSRQCQPAGTQIRLRNNIFKNIEDIQVGDSIVWYDNSKSFVCGPSTNSWNAVEKKVQQISCRDFYNDNLITIKTENGNISRYTPNHRTFIKLNKSEYCHAVYLMCDDNYKFRIGKIPFYGTGTSTSNPWRDKMYAEGCSKIWILKLFKTDKDARVLETKLSYKYQIPQTCWQLNKVQWTKEDLDFIYEGLNTKKSAEKCLKEFNRDIKYPLLDKQTEKSSHIHFATNAVTEIYACNIIPEVMSCLIYNPELKHRKQYEVIKEVKFEYIKESIKVYSLKVEGETYVADNIITHNSIYSFKGANYKYFMDLINNPFVHTYELNNNYRCGEEIISYAQIFLDNMRDIYDTPVHCKSGIEGEVERVPFNFKTIMDYLKEGDYKDWFILCRKNAEIEEIGYFLNKKKIPYVSFKKSEMTLEELNEKVNSNIVKLLTIHSAKGLESKNVIVIGAKTWNQEERRICYVAATRAKEKLVWMTEMPKKKPNYKMTNWG
nr:MAG TPA: REP HELICASE [Caudoviricetes sp.]